MENIATLSIEEIKRRLASKYNIEEDELDGLGYKTDDQVREYFMTVARQSHQIEGETESEKGVPVDAYKLTSKQQEELKQKKVLARKQASDDKKVEKIAKKAVFEANSAPLDHLKPEERVSYAEAQAAVAALNPPKKKSILRPKKAK